MKPLALLVVMSVMFFSTNIAYGLGGGGSHGDGRMLFLQNSGAGNGDPSNSGTKDAQTGSNWGTGDSGSGSGASLLSAQGNYFGSFSRSLSGTGSPEGSLLNATGPDPVTLPEPITLLFLGLGVLGLAGVRRRFNP